MAFGHFSAVDCFVVLVAAAIWVHFLYKRREVSLNFRDGVPLPPGPPARWFWDNALPSAKIARTFAAWVAEYGPLVTLRQGSHVFILIGRVDAATEIMEKEGSALVDRPESVSSGEMLSNNMRFVNLRAGERLRRFRKVAHMHLQQKEVKAYRDIQLEGAKDVIKDILGDPEKHQEHMLRFAASVILRFAYGKSTPTSNDDPEVMRIRQLIQAIQRVLRPGAYLVDRIPVLKYIPGYGREIRKCGQFECQLFRDQMERVRSEMETGGSGNSFMRMLLERKDEHGLSTDEMAYVTGDLFGAGSETIAIALTNMIMAAACYPEAQKRVQEELDVVVGRDRMPSWEDHEKLPQVQAYVLEALRWRPVAPIGFPHRATRDIIWRGQCIPEGATVYGCHWAISRDPDVFPEPERFDPQRWIDVHGRVRHDMNSFPYGFGRRVCPGRHFANQSLYIMLALLLWSFRIDKRAGVPIDVDGHSDAITARAAPFQVDFVVRVQGLVGMIQM